MPFQEARSEPRCISYQVGSKLVDSICQLAMLSTNASACPVGKTLGVRIASDPNVEASTRIIFPKHHYQDLWRAAGLTIDPVCIP